MTPTELVLTQRIDELDSRISAALSAIDAFVEQRRVEGKGTSCLEAVWAILTGEGPMHVIALKKRG